jgi:hypothetical protein
MLRHSFFAFLLTVLGFCSLSATALASNGTSVTAGINPARAMENRFAYELAPGESFEDTVTLSNASDEEVQFSVAGVDGVAGPTGTYLRDNNEKQEGVGSWIHFETSSFKLPPHSSIKVPFTLTIPESMAPGDYSGGIVGFDTVNADVSSGGGGATILTRVGVGFYVTVTGEPNFQFDWSGYSYKTDPITGFYTLDYVFENSGNISLLPTLTVTLKDYLRGEEVITPSLNPFYAGSDSKISVDWKNVPRFGLVKVTSKLDYIRFDAFGNMTEEEKSPYAGSLEKSVQILILPMKELAFAAVLFVLSFAFFYWRGKKWERVLATLKPKTIAKTESLTVLADHYNIDWKLLAKANAIKAPYIVQKGQKILLPSKGAGKASK